MLGDGASAHTTRRPSRYLQTGQRGSHTELNGHLRALLCAQQLSRCELLVKFGGSLRIELEVGVSTIAGGVQNSQSKSRWFCATH